MDAETVVMSGPARRVDFRSGLIVATQDVKLALFGGALFLYMKP